jgi:hypothetical protein
MDDFDFLEICKLRVQESQARLLESQKHLQTAQAAYQNAAQEANGWTLAYNSELRRREVEKANALIPSDATIEIDSNGVVRELPEQHSPNNDGNKTEAVRELLRRHPSGMTPAEIWKEVKTQITHRPYLYSILKRLNDRGDIKAKRKKYYFQFPTGPEENKGRIVVQ